MSDQQVVTPEPEAGRVTYAHEPARRHFCLRLAYAELEYLSLDLLS